MDSAIFEDCYNAYKNDFYDGKGWSDLAIIYGYVSGDALRSSFKRERKKRGLPSKNELNQPEVLLKTEKVFPKILCFDCELSLMRGYFFDLWEQNIRPEQIISDTFLISWSAKYLNEAKIYSNVLTPEEAKSGNDERAIRNIWNLLNDSNILIGQNIKFFDLKKLNVRFLHYGMPPIGNKQIIDTYIIAKNNFSFPSNSLKYINKFLGIKQKEENEGISLWIKAMDGDQKSLKIMNDYCENDTMITEDLYFKLLPFIHGGVNLAIYYDGNEKRCPNCGSTDLKEESFEYRNMGKYASYRCECGSIIRSKENLLDKDKRKSLLV